MTTATRPVLRLAVQSATGELARVFPTGPALLEALGDLNPDVRDALGLERARLYRGGYPEDLPLPALWWGAAATRSVREPGIHCGQAIQGHSRL